MPTTTQSIHEAVLLQEVVEGLITRHDLLAPQVSPSLRKAQVGEIASAKRPEQTPWYLDGTLGGAGHALAIIEAVKAGGGKLNMIGLDDDAVAIERGREILQGQSDMGNVGKVILENDNFRNLDKALDKNGIAKVDMILMDLGFSSDELESSGRGFSFMKDEPLLMTLGDPAKYPFTARDIVNGWDENVIADIIYGYGEERFARRIARAVISYREKKHIETSMELAEIVKSAVPAFARRGKTHPATKTFQALRIATNDELNALKEGLVKGYERLNIGDGPGEGGRMAIISFHSLEDRIVKEFFRKMASENGSLILTKKPTRPSAQELAENPRSRSAKLRIIQK
jgi:16S rRNA (cytosine1402-N4)-methyltransferase